jgi:hypothetical protein
MRGVQASAVEAHLLLSLVALTIDKELLTQAATELSGIVATEPGMKPIRDINKIEDQIRRLGRLYELGMKTDTEFETELRTLHAQLATAQGVTSNRSPNLQMR